VAYSYAELKQKTVADLRDIAKGVQHEAVQGYSQLNKEHLLVALCKALAIDTFEHHHAAGIDKTAIKARIRELKSQRDAALRTHDHDQLKATRRRLHRLNRQIRAHLA
jgi:hypothetical protein